MVSENPQEARSDPLSEFISVKQDIRLAQYSKWLGDMAATRQQSSAALLESIHKSRDQYQSFSDVEQFISPIPPEHMSRHSLLKEKMNILQTLKTSLVRACNADSDLPQPTKQYLQNVTMGDVDARITKDSTDLEAAWAKWDKWWRNDNISNKYLGLCIDIPNLIASGEGHAVGMLVILYWIAVAVITYRFQAPAQQVEAVELGLKHDFDIHMLDMFLAFSGAMLAVCVATSVQLRDLGRRTRDRFYGPSWGRCICFSIVAWFVGSMAYFVFRDSIRHNNKATQAGT